MDLDRLLWIVENPGEKGKESVSLYTETGIRSRKYHHKSRNGCKGCKRRRIKCDEHRPSCGQCTDRRKVCEYSSGAEHTGIDPTLDEYTLPRPQGSQCIESRPAVASSIVSVLEVTKPPCLPPETTVLYHWEHVQDVLDHFRTYARPWLGSTLCQRLMQQYAIPLSEDAPYLLHAVLAAAAAHLSTLEPDDERYQIASTVHYHRSLKLYSEAITGDLAEANADAIFGASILHALMAFIVSPKAPEGVTPAATNSSGAGRSPTWLKAWRGVGIMLYTPQLFTRLQTGVWLPVIRVHEAWRDARAVEASCSGMQPRACPITALWEFCKNGPGPRMDGMQIDRLHMLFHLPSAQDDPDGCISFMCNISPAEMGRLWSADVKALLVLCYWWALLGRCDQWWIGDSARIECGRILMRLEDTHDPRIHELLQFPAENSGYNLKESR